MSTKNRFCMGWVDTTKCSIHPLQKKVIIEVLGGVAEVTQCPDDVEVEIIDHDNLDEEPQEELLKP